ncbi:MAG: hypothetical protein BIFFINMI_01894 [Phycisphaerae bacterium]|nr:hypothetical protein [Phycisphaerae bacterium]
MSLTNPLIMDILPKFGSPLYWLLIVVFLGLIGFWIWYRKRQV